MEGDDSTTTRQLRFQGNALSDLREMPPAVRTAFGHQLWEIQNGITPENASPFELSHANEVMKLTERRDRRTFRCVYAAKFAKAVYVLHVFEKKSKSGIATPTKDIDIVYARLTRARTDYASAYPEDSNVPASPEQASGKNRKEKRT